MKGKSNEKSSLDILVLGTANSSVPAVLLPKFHPLINCTVCIVLCNSMGTGGAGGVVMSGTPRDVGCGGRRIFGLSVFTRAGIISRT